MKYLVRSLILLPAVALAQPAGGFRHIVIVVQENRSPDNLFGSNPTFEKGVDLAASGLNSLGQTIRLGPVPLASCYDVQHVHASFLTLYDKGRMDGADKEPTVTKGSGCAIGAHPQFRYVDNTTGTVQPYFDLASQYGWANRMFQTNQGASMAAHEFLFGGTSAPNPTSRLFADEQNDLSLGFGCTAASTQRVSLIDAKGSETAHKPIYPCFRRPTLATALDAAGLSWRYYINVPDQGHKSIWDAPSSIAGICGSNGQGGTAQCVGRDYVDHVILTQAQVLSDIMHCQMPAVSWVIPNATDSDHPIGNNGTGPAWVASIVNAVGQQAKCGAETYWDDTAILITWDDWGGWYDHVPPFRVGGQKKNGWGAGYTYGLRVPLLVVSAYTPAGTVNNEPLDFGSLLGFVESNFGLGRIGAGTYADAYAAPLTKFFTLSTPRGFTPIAAAHGPGYFLHVRRSTAPIDTD